MTEYLMPTLWVEKCITSGVMKKMFADYGEKPQ